MHQLNLLNALESYVVPRGARRFRLSDLSIQLYNNMQQEDSITSRAIALDSKKLAEASIRDSSSMKAIAVLTMVFLPSTAVAVSIVIPATYPKFSS